MYFKVLYLTKIKCLKNKRENKLIEYIKFHKLQLRLMERNKGR